MRRLVLALLLLAAEAAPVLAACYDAIGCTDRKRFRTSEVRRSDCEKLWTMRNAILAENGYCFEDARAAKTFSNDGCFVSSNISPLGTIVIWPNSSSSARYSFATLRSLRFRS